MTDTLSSNPVALRWRKRPVVIEAVRVTAADYNGSTWDGSPFTAWPQWLSAAMADGVVTVGSSHETDYAVWAIKTLEGIVVAEPGDWIIRGVEGEIYPCRDSIFRATYERVTDETSGEQR